MKKITLSVLPIILLTYYCLAQPGLSSLEKNITFIVPISVDVFSQNATLRIRLWNYEQIKISKKNSSCAVSYNTQTKTEKVHCPDGIKYQEVTPEEFTFSIQDINTSVEFKSSVIGVGEKYRLLISGLSNDNCNSASSDFRDMARSKIITMEKLTWYKTEMACP
jgi:hypothetical protein